MLVRSNLVSSFAQQLTLLSLASGIIVHQIRHRLHRLERSGQMAAPRLAQPFSPSKRPVVGRQPILRLLSLSLPIPYTSSHAFRQTGITVPAPATSMTPTSRTRSLHPQISMSAAMVSFIRAAMLSRPTRGISPAIGSTYWSHTRFHPILPRQVRRHHCAVRAPTMS